MVFSNDRKLPPLCRKAELALTSVPDWKSHKSTLFVHRKILRLWNDLYCVGWGVKL